MDSHTQSDTTTTLHPTRLSRHYGPVILMSEERAVSIVHAEWEIMNAIISDVDLSELRERMAIDQHSAKRFDKAAKEVLRLIDNRMVARQHNLPKTHPSYKPKED
jgi:hypothetical protein